MYETEVDSSSKSNEIIQKSDDCNCSIDNQSLICNCSDEILNGKKDLSYRGEEIGDEVCSCSSTSLKKEQLVPKKIKLKSEIRKHLGNDVQLIIDKAKNILKKFDSIKSSHKKICLKCQASFNSHESLKMEKPLCLTCLSEILEKTMRPTKYFESYKSAPKKSKEFKTKCKEGGFCLKCSKKTYMPPYTPIVKDNDNIKCENMYCTRSISNNFKACDNYSKETCHKSLQLENNYPFVHDFKIKEQYSKYTYEKSYPKRIRYSENQPDGGYTMCPLLLPTINYHGLQHFLFPIHAQGNFENQNRTIPESTNETKKCQCLATKKYQNGLSIISNTNTPNFYPQGIVDKEKLIKIETLNHLPQSKRKLLPCKKDKRKTKIYGQAAQLKEKILECRCNQKKRKSNTKTFMESESTANKDYHNYTTNNSTTTSLGLEQVKSLKLPNTSLKTVNEKPVTFTFNNSKAINFLSSYNQIQPNLRQQQVVAPMSVDLFSREDSTQTDSITVRSLQTQYNYDSEKLLFKSDNQEKQYQFSNGSIEFDPDSTISSSSKSPTEVMTVRNLSNILFEDDTEKNTTKNPSANQDNYNINKNFSMYCKEEIDRNEDLLTIGQSKECEQTSLLVPENCSNCNCLWEPVKRVLINALAFQYKNKSMFSAYKNKKDNLQQCQCRPMNMNDQIRRFSEEKFRLLSTITKTSQAAIPFIYKMKYFFQNLLVEFFSIKNYIITSYNCALKEAEFQGYSNANLFSLYPEQPNICFSSVSSKKIKQTVTIKNAQAIGNSSILLNWTIHSTNGIGGYEVYLDGFLKGKYFSPNRNLAIIQCDDLSITHIFEIKPVKKINFRHSRCSPPKEFLLSRYFYEPLGSYHCSSIL